LFALTKERTVVISEKITALVPQKRNKDRVNVHINGEYAFSLAAITAVGLQVGMDLSSEEIIQLREEDHYESAKQRAINFVSYRPRSISEVRDNLGQRNYDERTIDRVIARLEELEMVNDRNFARYWVEQRETFKPRSIRALQYELYQKGVPREIVEETLAGINEEKSAHMAGLAKAQRLAGYSEEKFREDIINFLKRRGFNYGVIIPVVDELWEQFNRDDEQD